MMWVPILVVGTPLLKRHTIIMKLKNILIPAACALFAVVGCERYDDSELSGRVDDLENRVTALEERVEEFQTSIDEFTALINQYKAEVRIKDFTEVSDGYLINFSDGTHPNAHQTRGTS